MNDVSMPPTPRQPRRIRTLARRVVLLLLVGLVSTVGTAVLLAVTGEEDRWQHPKRHIYIGGTQRRDSGVVSWEMFGGRRTEISLIMSPFSETSPFAGESKWSFLLDAIDGLAQARREGTFPPWWASVDTTFPTSSLPGPGYAITVEARGWPCPALWCEWRRQYWWDPSPAIGGFDLPGPSDALRAIPLRPVWAGLALDTLVHTAIWGVLWQGFIFARRRRRLRRGMCPSCAYPLAGLPENAPCPECGAARPAGVAKKDFST